MILTKTYFFYDKDVNQTKTNKENCKSLV